MHSLLSGIRVIDLSSIVLGPYGTQIIGDFGADVIKVEPPGGDLFRRPGPGRSPQMGAGFMNCNRNKRSVCLDLKSEDDLEKFYDLVRNADAVVHNMRHKAAQRLKVDFETLKEVNSQLIYTSSPGFGREGSYADDPAYDDVIQAASGVADLNKNEAGEPRFLQTIMCDKIGGLHLALAILGGLTHRFKTGKGCEIEAPMFESIVSFLMVEQLGAQSFNPPVGKTGYSRLQSPNRRPFKTKDSYIGILPYNSKHWASFLELAGRKDLAESDWVHDPNERANNIDSLYKVVSESAPKRTTAEWLKLLKEKDIPCAPINSLDDLLEDPHLTDIDFFPYSEHPTQGKLRTVKSPFSVYGTSASPDTDLFCPEIGQHNEEIFNEFNKS